MPRRVQLDKRRSPMYYGIHNEKRTTLVFKGMVGDVALIKRARHPVTGYLATAALRMSYKDRRVLVDGDNSDKLAVLQATNKWRSFANLCSKIDGPLCVWFFGDAEAIKLAFSPQECNAVVQRQPYFHVEVGGRVEDIATITQYSGPELHKIMRL